MARVFEYGENDLMEWEFVRGQHVAISVTIVICVSRPPVGRHEFMNAVPIDI